MITNKVGKWTIKSIEDDEYIGPWLATGREWENWMRQDAQFAYRPGTDIIDIGGNIGCNALMFSDFGPVHTFEPFLFNVLEENVKNNSTVHPITVHKYGLSSHDTQGSLYLPKCRNGLYNYGACSLKPNFENDHSNVSVPITLKKLDDVYTGVPSMLKIDVEGNELEVLEGSTRIISTHKPAMIVEIHDLSTSKIPDFLRNFGYTCIQRPHSNYLFYVKE
jgi:FkbM family methyltransferase